MICRQPRTHPGRRTLRPPARPTVLAVSTAALLTLATLVGQVLLAPPPRASLSAAPRTAAIRGSGDPAIGAAGLSVNSRTDRPLGVDDPAPVLGWQVIGGTQRAYRVRAASTVTRLTEPDLWDSGRVSSGQATGIRWAGTPLTSRQPVVWQVRVWGEQGPVSAWSAPSGWEMGLLARDDWGSAEWIEHPGRADADPLPQFARAFVTRAGRNVARARLYLAGLGVHAATVNGRPVTDAVLAGGQTNPQQSVEAGTYDITGLLQPGDNSLGVRLGNGITNVVNVPNPAVGRTGVYAKFTSARPETGTIVTPTRAGATSLKVTRLAGLAVGATIAVDTADGGVRLETRTVTAVGTAGADGTGIEVFPPLGTAHAAGAAITASGVGPNDAGRAVTPRLIARLEISYDDGSTDTVASDRSWRSSLGPYVTDHWYAGSDYDARREQVGWDAAAADLSAEAVRRDGKPTGWTGAGITAPPRLETALAWRKAPPVRIVEEFVPRRVSNPTGTEWVFDLGQNFAGFLRLNLGGGALPGGTVLRLRPAERLAGDGSGTADAASTGSATDVFDTYTTSGDPAGERWYGEFRYYGFQYVQVSGLPPGFVPDAGMLTGLHTRAAVEVSGEVTTSSDLVNRLHRMSTYSIASNMQAVFTDCPNREKLGWLADMIQSMPAIDRAFDMSSYLVHMARVMREAQVVSGSDAGLVPAIAPEYIGFGGGFRDDVNWGGAVVLTPWWLWKEHGDTRTMAEQYPSMMSYLEFVRRVQAGTGVDAHLVNGGLGDWAASDSTTPALLTGTAGYHQITAKLAEMADALGRPADAAELRGLAAEIRKAFNHRFFNSRLRAYTNLGNAGTTGSQAADALALNAGLVPDGEREHVLDSLVARIRAYHPNGGGPHLSGGMISLGQIIRALADNGRGDVLWELLHETTGPAYRSFLRPSPAHPEGLTTIPEYWDLRQSQNHMILLQIDEWFSTGLGGIRQASDSVGYRKIVIRPQYVGTTAHPLTHVRATYRTPNGTVTSEWRVDADSRINLRVSVPGNSVAEVWVPGGRDGLAVALGDRTAGDGHPASGVDVRGRRLDGDDAVVTVGPGIYEFRTEAPRGETSVGTGAGG